MGGRHPVTVRQSRFSLSSFPLSQTPPEPEKLVFRAPRLQLPLAPIGPWAADRGLQCRSQSPREPCQTGPSTLLPPRAPCHGVARSGSRSQPPTLRRLDQRREPKEGSPRAKSHVLSALFPKVPAAVLAVWYGIRYGVLEPGDSRSAELKIPAPRNHRSDLVHLQVHSTQREFFSAINSWGLFFFF